MTNPTFAVEFESEEEILRAVDATSLSSYPWGDIVPGLQWPEARYLLCCALIAIADNGKTVSDDEGFLEWFQMRLPSMCTILRQARIRHLGPEEHEARDYRLPFEQETNI